MALKRVEVESPGKWNFRGIRIMSNHQGGPQVQLTEQQLNCYVALMKNKSTFQGSKDGHCEI